MKDNNKIYLILILIFLNSLIFSLNNLHVIPRKSSVFIDGRFSKDIIFNDKKVFFDLSNDLAMFMNDYDSTSDLMASDDFIQQPNEVARIKGLQKVFQQRLYQSFLEKLEKSNMKLTVLDTFDEEQKPYIFEIKVTKYREGEYNLIQNIHSVITVNVASYQYNEKEKNIFTFSKTYKKKSDISNPIETIRLKNHADDIITDILKEVKKYYKITSSNSNLLKKIKKEKEIPELNVNNTKEEDLDNNENKKNKKSQLNKKNKFKNIKKKK